MTGGPNPRKQEDGNPDPVNNSKEKNNYEQKITCPFCNMEVGQLPMHLLKCEEK